MVRRSSRKFQNFAECVTSFATDWSLVTGHVPTHPFPEVSPDPNLTLTQTLHPTRGRVGTSGCAASFRANGDFWSIFAHTICQWSHFLASMQSRRFWWVTYKLIRLSQPPFWFVQTEGIGTSEKGRVFLPLSAIRLSPTPWIALLYSSQAFLGSPIQDGGWYFSACTLNACSAGYSWRNTTYLSMS